MIPSFQESHYPQMLTNSTLGNAVIQMFPSEKQIMCAFPISFRGNPFSPHRPHDSLLFDLASVLSSGETFLLASGLPGFAGPDSIRKVSFDLVDFLPIGELSFPEPSVEYNRSDSELRSDSDASEANNMRFSNSIPGECSLSWPVLATHSMFSSCVDSLFLEDFLLVDPSVVDNAAIVPLALSIPSVELPPSTDVILFSVEFSS
jgi:hypothetical protein